MDLSTFLSYNVVRKRDSPSPAGRRLLPLLTYSSWSVRYDDADALQIRNPGITPTGAPASCRTPVDWHEQAIAGGRFRHRQLQPACAAILWVVAASSACVGFPSVSIPFHLRGSDFLFRCTVPQASVASVCGLARPYPWHHSRQSSCRVRVRTNTKCGMIGRGPKL